jgi:hypothetical protein
MPASRRAASSSGAANSSPGSSFTWARFFVIMGVYAAKARISKNAVKPGDFASIRGAYTTFFPISGRYCAGK